MYWSTRALWLKHCITLHACMRVLRYQLVRVSSRGRRSVDSEWQAFRELPELWSSWVCVQEWSTVQTHRPRSCSVSCRWAASCTGRGGVVPQGVLPIAGDRCNSELRAVYSRYTVLRYALSKHYII